MHEEKIIQNLEVGAEYIHEGWIQNALIRGDKVCALGANRRARNSNVSENLVLPEDEALVNVTPRRYKVATSVMRLAALVVNRSFDDVPPRTFAVIIYNDAPWRRKRAVEKLFSKAIRRLKRRQRFRRLGELLSDRLFDAAENKLQKKSQSQEDTVTIPRSELLTSEEILDEPREEELVR
jgi:hypothetical protein